ncbi:MAG TPA: NAD-dependent epimerase/dehydratase family protein [Edaphobacter sp.]|nr:NAD-dependent epimerase/dehydratase family protein [Edaphobacter sp.]
MQRRSFLKHSLYTSATAALSGKVPLLADTKPKDILVLGGTFFLGPAVVEAALAAGHTVTLFNRGVTYPELFPYVEKIRGFRSSNPDDENLSGLGKRHWDVVIDVWPSDPLLAESAAKMLAPRTDHYLYVSSIGAYDNIDKPGIDETHPIQPWNSVTGGYGPEKAESERRLHSIVGERLTIVRPGPIKGVRSYSSEMMTWFRRVLTDQSIIAPGDGSDGVEIVDVRDVAAFLFRAIDRSIYGVFNLTGPAMTYREFLEKCKAATDSDAELVWIPLDYLRTQGISAQDFPFLRPGSNVFRISSKKAYDAGWDTRPFRDTAFDELESVSLLQRYRLQDTLPADKQREVLRSWRSRAQ